MGYFISIIIPTYNRKKYISRALDSIFNQGYKDCEIIIIDDNSTDDTKNVIEKYQIGEKRIKYIKNTVNRGVNYSRNRGIKASSGKWIAFLDSDDEYLPDSLLSISSILKTNSNIDVVGFKNLVSMPNSKKYIQSGLMLNDWKEYCPSYEDIVFKNNIKGDIHIIINKRVFNQKYYFLEDVRGLESIYFASLAKNNFKFKYFNINTVIVHCDAGDRLSIRNHNIGSAQFAKKTEEFMKDHWLIIKKYPEKKIYYSLKIASYYLRARNLNTVYWLIKAMFYKISSVLLKS